MLNETRCAQLRAALRLLADAAFHMQMRSEDRETRDLARVRCESYEHAIRLIDDARDESRRDEERAA